MNSIHDTSRDAEPVAQLKKMEGFGGGGNSGPVDEFRNSPAGGGPSAGSGGMGNFDQRTATGAMGAVGGMLNKAKAALEQNEYAAKAMGHMQTAAQQAAGAVGFGGGQAGQQYSQAADGSVPQGGAYGGNMGTYAGGPPVGGADGGQWGQQSQPAAQPQSSMPNKIKVEAGEYEAKIIDDLCEPSGARPNPSKEVLAKFVKQCGSLDADLCCALLEEKLEDEDWKVCLKALVGIEVLVTSKKDGVVDYFDGNDELIKEISVDPESQKSLKLAAEKCLKAFEKAKAAPVVDNGMADMFSGMAMMDEPAAAPDPLGFGGGAPAAAAPAATMDLSFMGAAAAPVTLQAPAQSAAAPAAPAPAPVDPLFAGVGGGECSVRPAPFSLCLSLCVSVCVCRCPAVSRLPLWLLFNRSASPSSTSSSSTSSGASCRRVRSAVRVCSCSGGRSSCATSCGGWRLDGDVQRSSTPAACPNDGRYDGAATAGNSPPSTPQCPHSLPMWR
jgi:hypothetical protein